MHKGLVYDVTHCFNLEKKMRSFVLIKCLPPYIMKWIIVSCLFEEHNRHNRVASTCPGSFNPDWLV